MTILKNIPRQEIVVAIFFGISNCVCHFAVELFLYLIRVPTFRMPAIIISFVFVFILGLIFGYISGRHIINPEKTYSIGIAFRRGALIGCLSLITYLVVLSIVVPLVISLFTTNSENVSRQGFISEIHSMLQISMLFIAIGLSIPGWIVVLLSGIGGTIIYKLAPPNQRLKLTE
jgi:hypothetical protein